MVLLQQLLIKRSVENDLLPLAVETGRAANISSKILLEGKFYNNFEVSIKHLKEKPHDLSTSLSRI